eukprot:COSAG01_NODE_2604_length_7393_cov_11.578146_2_plen_181_part_00
MAVAWPPVAWRSGDGQPDGYALSPAHGSSPSPAHIDGGRSLRHCRLPQRSAASPSGGAVACGRLEVSEAPLRRGSVGRFGRTGHGGGMQAACMQPRTHAHGPCGELGAGSEFDPAPSSQTVRRLHATCTAVLYAVYTGSTKHLQAVHVPYYSYQPVSQCCERWPSAEKPVQALQSSKSCM